MSSSDTELLNGRYHVIGKIGFGAESFAFKIEDRLHLAEIGSGRIKVGKRLLYATEEDVITEAINLRLLCNHKNIVRLYDYFTLVKSSIDPVETWLIMEYCPDGDLDNLIQTKLQNRSLFLEKEIIDIFLQIIEGVRYIHSQNVVHRDIKPKNVFLTAGTVKIGDFGVSKVQGSGEKLRTLTGTPGFMSPEAWNREGFDKPSDIWSCGCLLYEMCCLENPYTDNRRRQEIRRSLGERYNGKFEEPYKSLIREASFERITAEGFLATFFTNHKNSTRTVILLGAMGVGKSSLGNLIAGSEIFKTSASMEGCTETSSVYRSNATGITIIDTMGMADPDKSSTNAHGKLLDALKIVEGGIDTILFCMEKSRTSLETSYLIFKTLLKLFGNDFKRVFCLVLTKAEADFVYGDDEVDIDAEQEKFLSDCLKGEGKAAAMFREIHTACSGRAIFIENPRRCKSNAALEDSYSMVRRKCREKLIDFILSQNNVKFSYNPLGSKEEESSRWPEQLETFLELPLIANKEEWKQVIIRRDKYRRQRRIRIWYHESYCTRYEGRRCVIMEKAINRSNSRVIWLEHNATAQCLSCKFCQFCFLDWQLENLYRDDEVMINVVKHQRSDEAISLEKQIAVISETEQAKYRSCSIL